VITGAHHIISAHDADAARAFFRDVLGFEAVDAGGGWLIFALPPTELAVHPTVDGIPVHQLYLMCDDIEATIEELGAKGVEFEGGVADEGWGLVAQMRVPGAGPLGIYEPRHASPLG